MRLINADAYMEKVRHEAKAMPQKQGKTFVTLSEWIMEKTPSIESKRGEWIDQEHGAFYSMECSICHKPPFCDDEGFMPTPYCPYCGANMREGESE